MTVKELIEELGTYDSDSAVFITDDEPLEAGMISQFQGNLYLK